MMHKILLLITLLSGLLVASENGLRFGLDVGQSKDHVDIYRAVVQKDFTEPFYTNDFVAFSGYHELSLNFWDAKSGNDISGFAYSPVFTLGFFTNGGYMPYVEAAIGLALLSHKRIDDRDLSSVAQFEDRFGIGIKKGNFDFHIRYMHYSNAGFHKPNDGIDIALAGFSYKF
jgi:lipid A 3-O-deacylase